MVWPNRGTAGVIRGYGLNVLKLLQTGHRCGRHTTAPSAGRDNVWPGHAPSAALFGEAPAGPSPHAFRRPTEGARDAKGPEKTHGPRLPRGNEACRSRMCLPLASPTAGHGRKSARSQGVPRAVSIGLLRQGPRKSDDSCVRAVFRRGPDQQQAAPLTGVPPGRQGPLRRASAPGPWRLGPPGRCSASPLHRKLPATAPRPASGDADQTPLGSEGGMPHGL